MSYRRADSQDVVGRIYDRLIAHFSVDDVFLDLDNLPLGKPFPQALDEKLANASVALIVIGRNWLTASDATGERRLDDPTDFVRLEVEKALWWDIPVVPILVSNASMPTASELPESMRSLVLHQGVAVRPDPDFHRDMDRLIERLTNLLTESNITDGSRTKRTLKAIHRQWFGRFFLEDDDRVTDILVESVAPTSVYVARQS